MSSELEKTVWQKFDDAAASAQTIDAKALIAAMKAMTQAIDNRLSQIEHQLAATAEKP